MSKSAEYLLTARAIRERCETIFERGVAGSLAHFAVHLEKLPQVAAFVLQTTKERYPSLEIPYHSRYRHLEAGSEPRLELIRRELDDTPTSSARALLDLVVISVLLDAGAGATWCYHERRTGKLFRSSEGLGVASFDLFYSGILSTDPRNPLQVVGSALTSLAQQQLEEAFQVSAENPLLGVPGRLQLLQRLGAVLGSTGRPSDLVSELQELSPLPASAILELILRRYGSIWPTRYALDGYPLGDVWMHSAVQSTDSTNGFVPFHKLSQWLTYSLVEPLAESGVQVVDLDTLTGLPEYRNGGLLIDSGLLTLRDESARSKEHEPGSELIVEWRALTVALLDRIAAAVRQMIGATKEQFPLARVLEGGTWAAGRKIARQLRPAGTPPLQIRSDGTVF